MCDERRSPWFPRLASLLGVAVAVLAAGCESSAPALTPTPNPTVTVGPPLARTITDYEQFTGRVEAVESVEIRARVSGYLQKVNFHPGEEVKKGDVLFLIDERPYKADLDRAVGEVARAEAHVKKTAADFVRAQGLRNRNVLSNEDFDKAIADRDEAAASLQASKATFSRADLDMQFTHVTAPIAGRISRALITEGNLVSVGPTGSPVLTTIVSLDPIYVYFDADERSLLRYQRRTPESRRAERLKSLKIPVEVGLSDEPGYPHVGYLDFADNKIDSGTGTIQLRGVFENQGRMLTPGLFARVRVPVGQAQAALLVPERAILTDQGLKFVWIVNDQKVVERRDVRLGSLNEGWRVVLAGLKPDDQVIVNGIQRVRDGAKVETHPAETPAATAATAPAAAPSDTVPKAKSAPGESAPRD